MELHTLLKAERKKRFSMDDVASTFKEWGIDCSQSTLSRVENGSIPSWPIVDGYCKLFGWSLAELERRLGRTSSAKPVSVDNIIERKRTVMPTHGREIAVLSWVQAGNWGESPSIDTHNQEMKFVPGKSPKNSFLLKVSGTSMENCEGKDHFPNGSYILVNPDVSGDVDEYVGKFVVAVDEATQETTFKQLIDDCGIKYLKPLNLQYPVIKVTTTTHIKGVVCRVIDDRRV
ncbi:SOS-response transcriptional repressor LexA (RecA-mediated autopeptidase) [Vibrio xiamenensis]|uniref:SOS-response transcriptional repressor LexA (RecA-mediated autopeptidase) n=1 Tax=Vibrio xiamenensis TaxID=861298 RepID=A0A1G8HP88_9VIBR|nr:S24 family peptidase [Vibrio xiamenensis]SDI08455.1 SOS-response transcriptional repressor LexA (RecA-mediated autopeptidase) [Vibrio xiamenensis]